MLLFRRCLHTPLLLYDGERGRRRRARALHATSAQVLLAPVSGMVIDPILLRVASTFPSARGRRAWTGAVAKPEKIRGWCTSLVVALTCAISDAYMMKF